MKTLSRLVSMLVLLLTTAAANAGETLAELSEQPCLRRMMHGD
jgi:hypothetical protein